MTEIDFGNIYNSSGQLVQLRYAQKAISAGSTVLAIRNARGVVLVVAKPITSELHVQDLNNRIHKLSENVCAAFTGMLSDAPLILRTVKLYITHFRNLYGHQAEASLVKESLATITHRPTRYSNSRPFGVSSLFCVRDSDSYHILLAENTGKVSEYSAYAIGSGASRAITELERGDFDSMEMIDLVDYAVKTLYMSYDSLSEAPFCVEAAMISDDSDGKFVRVTPEIIGQAVDKYSHMSVDDTE